MREVRIIQPITAQAADKLRVAAYARVSSDSADQRNSFAAQVKYYTQFIQAHADWQFVDIYADQGITGTRADKREEFLRLLADCRAGKIDKILVKSVSRFARNAQDCIRAVRELKDLGVTVAFEKERINTAVMGNEMFLSMMSAFAQEESISISKNMRKGAVMRMQNGTFRLSQPPYGYRLDENGMLVIQPQEAEIVRRIFESFLTGKGIQQIGKELEDQNIPKFRGEAVWSKNVVRYILTNERYAGDELFQKAYRDNNIPFTRYLNDGAEPQYYAENTHPAIIPSGIFQKAQQLFQKKQKEYGEQMEYPFTQKLSCSECGSVLYRRVTARGTRWVCSRHLHHPEQCGQKGIAEDVAQESFCILLHKLSQNQDAILGEYLKQLQELKDREFLIHSDVMELNRQIAVLSEQNHALHSLRAKECIDSAFFIAQTNELGQKMDRLRKDLQRCREGNDYMEMMKQTKQLISLLSAPSGEFDPEIFQRVVQKVAVSDLALVFHLKNGLKLEERQGQNE